MEILRSHNLERTIKPDVLRLTELETRKLASRLAFWLTGSDTRPVIEEVPRVMESERQHRIEQGFVISLLVLMA